jgi:hypothetical protein
VHSQVKLVTQVLPIVGIQVLPVHLPVNFLSVETIMSTKHLAQNNVTSDERIVIPQMPCVETTVSIEDVETVLLILILVNSAIQQIPHSAMPATVSVKSPVVVIVFVSNM